MAHYRTLRLYALKLTRNTADAEDLLHDTIVRALEYRNSFHGGDLIAWLSTIMYSRFCSQLRRSKRVSTADDQLIELLSEPVPCKGLLTCHLEEVEEGLRRLPSFQRDALMHLVCDGLEYAEIAAAQGVRLGTAKSRIARARAALETLT